jgi:hypothetical protein
MNHGFLSENVKITKVNDVAASANTDLNSGIVDMAGFDGVLFLTSLGTAAANNTLHVETGDLANMDDAADIAGSELGVGSSDEDLWVDVMRPRERYVRVVVTRGTATTVENIWAIQYRAKDGMPIDNETAGTIHGEKVGPFAAEGTK